MQANPTTATEPFSTRALIYCRVSSTGQKTEGSGLESQEHRCREHCATKRYTVEKVFHDDYTGGGDFMRRPSMAAMLAFLDDNSENEYVVVFDDLKRFARDTLFHFKLRKALAQRGARPECLTFNFEDTPEGEFIETILAAQGQLERKQNARQVKNRMKARLEAGYWCLPAPLGMEFQRVPGSGKRLVPIQAQVSILTEALEGFAAGRLPQKADVREFLHARRHKLQKQRITFDMVTDLLTNPLYAGLVEYPAWGVTRREGQHRPLISVETFEAAQARVAAGTRTRVWTEDSSFPLRRLVQCAVCSRRLTSSTARGCTKRYALYTCNNTSCTSRPKNVQRHVLEASFQDLLRDLTPRSGALETLKRVASLKWEHSLATRRGVETSLRQQVRSREEQIERFVDLIATTELASMRARYERRVGDLEAELKGLRQRLATAGDEVDFGRALDAVLEILARPMELWGKADSTGRSMIHRLVFRSTPGYHVPTNSWNYELTPIFAIEKTCRGGRSALVDLGDREWNYALAWIRETGPVLLKQMATF
jgi:DNA invertase Pin-like site-specific DNA recombinase